MKRIIQITLMLAFIMLAVQPVIGQNFMIKQKAHSDETNIMGQTQPAKDVIQTIWFSKDAIATIDEENTIINDLKNKTMTVINHVEKTYTEMSMNFDFEADDDEETQGIASLMQGMMKTEISVEPTGENKKVGKWNCKGYKFTMKTMMGPLTQIMYATNDVKIDKKLYRQYMTSAMAMFPGLKDKIKELNTQMGKIKGVVVRTEIEMKVMGSSIKSNSEVIEIKQTKAPAKVFKIPSGYTKQASPF
ncbi:DUF4412 domain-containing protein [bacterium]|nr:DUF4412 domain-containing protein [bacterium]